MRDLTPDEFADALATFDQTARRLELQRWYEEPSERDTVDRFLHGHPQPPTEVAGLRDWYAQVGDLTRQGRRVERVRVHDDPPTDYQRWERWIGQWNVAAGEHIRYMTQAFAWEVGLLPAAGELDWWLLDENRLVVMRFDAAGRRVSNWLVTDAEPVDRACEWWDLAVRHSEPDELPDAAAAA